MPAAPAWLDRSLRIGEPWGHKGKYRHDATHPARAAQSLFATRVVNRERRQSASLATLFTACCDPSRALCYRGSPQRSRQAGTHIVPFRVHLAGKSEHGRPPTKQDAKSLSTQAAESEEIDPGSENRQIPENFVRRLALSPAILTLVPLDDQIERLKVSRTKTSAIESATALFGRNPRFVKSFATSRIFAALTMAPARAVAIGRVRGRLSVFGFHSCDVRVQNASEIRPSIESSAPSCETRDLPTATRDHSPCRLNAKN